MLLSISMIVKNEEKNLHKSLSAIKALDGKIDYEIVIVDTGSNDKTIEIAREYTNKVYEHKWTGDFSEMRNISIKYCKGKWILVLDADEVLENPIELIRFLNSKENIKYQCAAVKFKNIISDKEDNYLIGSLVRLFKNTKDTYYTGIIHEQPNIINPVSPTNITFIHYGYSREDFEVMKYKYERNLELLKKDLVEGKDEIYTLFQLAQTYSMANENLQALKSIYRAFKLVQKEENIKRYLYVYHFYARELLAQNYFEKSIEVCEEAIKLSKCHLDFYYLLARAYRLLDRYKEAELYFKEYFNLHNKIENGYIVEDISVACFSFSRKNEMIRERILNNYKMEDYDKVINCFTELNEDSYRNEVKEIYIYSLLKLDYFNEIKEFLKDKSIEDKDIQSLVNIIEKLYSEESEEDFNEKVEYLLLIDKRLRKYIEIVYFNLDTDVDEINYNEFYLWKVDLLKKSIITDDNLEKNILSLREQDIRLYINHIVGDYNCLKKLYDYSKNNILCDDLEVLTLVNCIEEVLVVNNSINNEKYEDLINRIYINKNYYINRTYNSEILQSEYVGRILSKYEYFWFIINKSLDIYNEDKIGYINNLKKLLKEVPEYKRVVEYYLNEISKNPISEEMIREKENLLVVVEGLVSENRVGEAEEILLQLKDIFKFDVTILNSLGVVKYINGDYYDAIKLVALADTLEDNFNVKYNLASLLNEVNKKELANKYFKEAYNLCEDDELRDNIYSIINK
ncbi:glycosyltransferase [Clostridium paraputrificum]|uniref:glycosyltransferase n=1 Tax=Clostridium paraputrificum TaxID=29363 RepID=UPI003D353839